ncbi:MAG: response regulator [Lachnospiraceae bacterium]|nr:response regulator [Lachnospiraceae bacterium]
MKTLLIVEDEKLIRQGIHVMAKRSEVPIDQIIECANGEEALQILERQPVDVMFTDIRMQHMDGLELVHRVHQMPHPPLMVAISGYDDFSYAVEMLRNGVREYLLKPVEREKIRDILMKLEEELSKSKETMEADKRLSVYQLKALLRDKELSAKEREILVKKNAPFFLSNAYCLCLFGTRVLLEDDFVTTVDGDGAQLQEVFLGDLEEGQLLILPAERVDVLLNTSLYDVCVGVSDVHQGLEEIDVAFGEAKSARDRAFATGSSFRYGTPLASKVPQAMHEKAAALLSADNRTKRIQVLGAGHTDEVIRLWSAVFRATADLHLSVEDFTYEMQRSFGEISGIYKETVERGDEEMIRQCMNPVGFDCLQEYQDLMMDWLVDISQRLGARMEDGGVTQKLLAAEQYIKENYSSDLNMAVVSNYVSMNYSFFSYSFKQRTGQSFVNYLKMIRMNEAKKLLTETDMKIMEISACVGYENEKHFMKTFKALMGVSPGEFRKNMRHGSSEML